MYNRCVLLVVTNICCRNMEDNREAGTENENHTCYKTMKEVTLRDSKKADRIKAPNKSTQYRYN